MLRLLRFEQHCQGFGYVGSIDPVLDAWLGQDRRLAAIELGENLELQARCIAHLADPFPRAKHSTQPHAQELALPELGMPRHAAFRREFAQRIKRNRVAGSFFIEYPVALTCGAVGCRGREIDNPANAMADRCAQDRDLSQYVDLEDALGSSPLQMLASSNRGTKDDRIAATGDKGSDPFRVQDLGPNKPEPFPMIGQGSLRRLRQLLAIVQRHVMAARQQGARQIQADKTGPAKDNDPHRGRAMVTIAWRRNSAPDPYPIPDARSVSPPRLPCVRGSGRSLLRPNVFRPPR